MARKWVMFAHSVSPLGVYIQQIKILYFSSFLATNFIQEHYCCCYCLQRGQQLREISLPTDRESSPVFLHVGSWLWIIILFSNDVTTSAYRRHQACGENKDTFLKIFFQGTTLELNCQPLKTHKRRSLVYETHILSTFDKKKKAADITVSTKRLSTAIHWNLFNKLIFMC